VQMVALQPRGFVSAGMGRALPPAPCFAPAARLAPAGQPRVDMHAPKRPAQPPHKQQSTTIVWRGKLTCHALAGRAGGADSASSLLSLLAPTSTCSVR